MAGVNLQVAFVAQTPQGMSGRRMTHTDCRKSVMGLHPSVTSEAEFDNQGGIFAGKPSLSAIHRTRRNRTSSTCNQRVYTQKQANREGGHHERNSRQGAETGSSCYFRGWHRIGAKPPASARSGKVAAGVRAEAGWAGTAG